MITIRQKDASLVPIVWQASHMAGYAGTGVIGLTSSVSFYLAVVRSSYHCYLYNEALTVHDVSREKNQTVLSDEKVWYQNPDCYDPFTFSLKLSIFSVVWMSLFLVFGRGGSSVTESDHSKYFSDMVGQWHVVFYANCFNFWYLIKSILISLHFTNGYLIFAKTVFHLQADNYFRSGFEKIERLYYIRTIVLLWCQSSLCTFNFLLTILRCTMGVDFDVDFESDEPVAGPSNLTKLKSPKSVILYEDIKLEYVGSKTS